MIQKNLIFHKSTASIPGQKQNYFSKIQWCNFIVFIKVEHETTLTIFAIPCGFGFGHPHPENAPCSFFYYDIDDRLTFNRHLT